MSQLHHCQTLFACLYNDDYSPTSSSSGSVRTETALWPPLSGVPPGRGGAMARVSSFSEEDTVDTVRNLPGGSLLLSTVIIFITELTQLLLHPVHGVQLTLARHYHEILHLQQVLQIKYTFLHWNDIIQFYTKIITFISQRLAKHTGLFPGSTPCTPIHQCLTITAKFHGFYILPKVWE